MGALSRRANIVESGLRAEPAPTLERTLTDCTRAMCSAIQVTVLQTLTKITETEREAIARLHEYVPTEPLLDSRQAAAYLQIPLRTLQLKSCPSNPLIPHVWIDGLKRFRKTSLDSWLDKNEVKAPEVKL